MLAPIALLISFLLATVMNPVQSVVCIYDEVTSIQAATSNKSVLGATVSGEPSGHAAVIVDDVVDIAQAVKGETSTMIPLGAELIYFSRREVSPTGVLSCLPCDCQHAFQLGPTMICPTQVDVHKLDANKVARLVDYMDIKSAFLKWSWVLDTTLVGRVVFGNFCVTKSSEYNIMQPGHSPPLHQDNRALSIDHIAVHSFVWNWQTTLLPGELVTFEGVFMMSKRV
ncbi:hypothetical protein BKA83DRAFT_4128310 [Pisolithus microcarpus]|nr:hypothetical protein BKA83DRAFT_4128310 [Pisolithus microcarpus]